MNLKINPMAASALLLLILALGLPWCRRPGGPARNATGEWT
jgi:hypothetical protein